MGHYRSDQGYVDRIKQKNNMEYCRNILHGELFKNVFPSETNAKEFEIEKCINNYYITTDINSIFPIQNYSGADVPQEVQDFFVKMY